MLMGFAPGFDTYQLCGFEQIDVLASLNPHEVTRNNSSLRGLSGGSKERTVQVHCKLCANVSHDGPGEVRTASRFQAGLGLSRSSLP